MSARKLLAATAALALGAVLFLYLSRPLDAQVSGVAGWLVFESTQGGYKVAFPGKPVMKRGKMRTDVGEIVSVRHTSGSADATYDVTYNDYPKQAVTSLSAVKVLDAQRDGLVFQSKGTLSAEKPFALGKLAGREFEIEGEGGMRYRIRLLLVENRLYQLTAMAQSPARADDRKFFDSFQLTRMAP